MDRSTPGFPVLHHLLELAQTRVHPVGDAVQPSHPPSSPSLPALHPARGQVECIKCPKMMRVLKRSFYLWFMFLLRCCKIRHCFLQKIQSKYSLTYRILLRRYHRSESGTRRMTMHTKSLFHLPVNQEEHPMANQCVPLPQSRRSGACPHFCFIYVVASGRSCAVWILHCVIQISYCGVRTLWLWHVGSAVVACRLSRSVACERLAFPDGSTGKEISLQCKTPRFDSWLWKVPWRRKWQPTPVSLPGESHEQRSLGVLQSMGSYRDGHEWVTKYMWDLCSPTSPLHYEADS